MVESFKEYRKRKLFPVMETCFGAHSLPQNKLSESSYETVDHDKLHATHDLNTSNLSKDQKKAVEVYTSSSLGLNGYLHNKHKSLNAASNYKSHADLLTAAMDKQKTKSPLNVYTGVLKSPAEHFTHDKPVTVHLPAFTSTSTSRAASTQFAKSTTHKNDANHGIDSTDHDAKHIIKIHLPVGTSAASVRSHSNIQEENEILLNRGHNIEIHHKPEHIGNNIWQWNAHVVSHTPDKL